MAQMKPYVLVAVFVLLIAIQGTLVQGVGNNNGNGNNGNNNGNGNNGNNNNGNNNGNGNNGNNNGNGNNEDHDDLAPLESGQEQAKCKAKGHCKDKVLVCPAQCPEKKPKKNRKHKGCFVDCTSKCEIGNLTAMDTALSVMILGLSVVMA
uniref:4Fe-4S ferredoxin-type domain-containing protein n=1 Tax=Salix viminalis TaxID=40686 RepID=A0A6N2L5R7_SALVM